MKDLLLGDYSKARRAFGWTPKVNFKVSFSFYLYGLHIFTYFFIYLYCIHKLGIVTITPSLGHFQAETILLILIFYYFDIKYI